MSSVMAIVLCGVVGQGSTSGKGLAPFFDAIRMVETGASEQPEKAVGDGGRSLGPYQISRAYLADSGVRGDWCRCRDQKYSEAVMLAYWKRHCPDALRKRDYETLARVHNGGPNGHRKAATMPYWNMVRGILRPEQVAMRNSGSGAKRRGRVCDPFRIG